MKQKKRKQKMNNPELNNPEQLTDNEFLTNQQLLKIAKARIFEQKTGNLSSKDFQVLINLRIYRELKKIRKLLQIDNNQIVVKKVENSENKKIEKIEKLLEKQNKLFEKFLNKKQIKIEKDISFENKKPKIKRHSFFSFFR